MEVQYIHFEMIDSTNSWAKSHTLELDSKKITCITADEQTAGYGRQGRDWISKKGNLHLSLFFVIPKNHPIIPNLAQLLTFSVAKVLMEEEIPVTIKWPNDLLFQEQKLSGILVEMVPMHESIGAILGLGLNVHSSVQTDQPTTALCEIGGKSWDLVSLTKQICTRFQYDLHALIAHGFGFFKEDFENMLAFKNEKISCQVGDKTIEGVLDSLTEKGYLNIKLETGKLLSFSSGDIQSLRKL